MVLELRNVGFTYRRSESAALSDISLQLGLGQMHAILGPLGSGTSTLCRLITGLLGERGTASGSVGLEGTAMMLGDDPEAQLSGMTSRVGDEVQLPGRLRAEAPATVEARARRAVESLGIGRLWERRLETLSGGQRQLTALAGLLTLRPSLLVLDQPTLSLDPDTRQRLVSALREFCTGGGSVLITSHQFDELSNACQTRSFLHAGELVDRPSTVLDEDLADYGIWDSRVPENRSSAASVHPETAACPEATAPLSVRDLRVVRGEARVLDGIDLDLGAGEIITLMGPNGAGKSTLLRALLGLLERGALCTGEISVDHLGEGLRLDGQPTRRRARHLGWVGQDPGSQLSSATVRDELLRSAPLPAHRRRDREHVRARRESAADSALAATGLTAFSRVHPYDLDIARRKDLVMATALIAEPKILLLDEPTLGRDRAAMTRLNTFISEFLDRGGSILATSHDRRWAEETSHRVLRLHNGRLESARRVEE